MGDEKTRKVGIEEFLNSTAVSSKLSKAANAAMNGDRMTREYRRSLSAAIGPDAAYRAAFGAMHGAAYSEANRVAEMTRAALVPQLTGASATIRQLFDAAHAHTTLRELDYVKQLRRDVSAFNPSLTRGVASLVESAMERASLVSHGLDASIVEKMNNLQDTMRGSLTSALPERRERPIAILRPRTAQNRPNPAAQFMASFKHQYDEAMEQAEEEGGEVVVVSKTPTGDVILVKQLSSLDQHFIQVTGVDQHNQPRSFKANCAGLALQIEIVPISEELEDQDDEDDEVVN